MLTGLRTAFVAVAGLLLVAASNTAAKEPVAIDAPAAPQPDRAYAFVLDGSQKSASQAVDARLPYDFSSRIDENTDVDQEVIRTAGSLRALVRSVDTANVTIDDEFHCLATAVYFESKGEPLEGQLAVAQVILNRVEARTFANSICGVVHQPKQFSFSKTAKIPYHSQNWRTAIAISKIAIDEQWQEIAPDALFFHANYVSPSWRQRLVRVSQVGAHIFYR